MAKSGKHALPGGSKVSTGKKAIGAHAISREEKSGEASFGLTRKKKEKKIRKTFTLANALKALLLAIICFIMVSPLKSCLLSDDGYIGVTAAQNIAFEDSGILSEKANNIQTDVIKIDGEVYYKIQFTGSVTDYRYIINASSGEITARAFYHVDGEK